eukprot:845364_1
MGVAHNCLVHYYLTYSYAINSLSHGSFLQETREWIARGFIECTRCECLIHIIISIWIVIIISGVIVCILWLLFNVWMYLVTLAHLENEQKAKRSIELVAGNGGSNENKQPNITERTGNISHIMKPETETRMPSVIRNKFGKAIENKRFHI